MLFWLYMHAGVYCTVSGLIFSAFHKWEKFHISGPWQWERDTTSNFSPLLPKFTFEFEMFGYRFLIIVFIFTL